MKKAAFALLVLTVFAAASAAPAAIEWVSPLPQGNAYNGACAIGGEIYLVGNGGAVVRFDGSCWSLMTFPWKENLRGIWGSSPSDIHVVGKAANSAGGFYHYDGTSWTLSKTDLYTPYSLWGSASDEVFAGCDGGKIRFYDGSGWTDLSPGMGVTYTVNGIWGTSAYDVFAIAGPYIVRWDGAAWAMMTDLGGGAGTAAVWGSAGDDVFVSGYGSKVYHYDGSDWSVSLDAGSTYWMRALWGRSASEVYAFGGAIPLRGFRFDGASWIDITAPARLEAYAATGTAARGVVVAGDGGQLLGYDGAEWERISRFVDYNYLGVWGSSAADVYVVGDDFLSPVPEERMVNRHFDGVSWSGFTLPGPGTAVWGSSTSDVFIGTGQGYGGIYHYDGAAWTEMTRIGYEQINAIWGTGPDDVFAVGDGSYPLEGRISHYDGAQWTVMTELEIEPRDVWGGSGTDVFAGCDFGKILHYGGSTWSVSTDTGTGSWTGVWGTSGSNVYAVSSQRILRYDGETWAEVATGLPWLTPNYRGIWGSGPADIFVVSQGVGSAMDQVWGRIYHYDGSSWVDANFPCESGLYRVWGSSGENVYAVGDGVNGGGALLHYRGGSFFSPTPVPVRTPTPVPTLIPVKTPTPVPTLIPVRTPTPVPTLIPVRTPTPPGPTPVPSGRAVIGDYDGDGTSDIALFRPATGLWLVRGLTRVWFGSSSDEVVPRDYSGNGAWDFAVYRPSLGKWMVRGVTSAFYGVATDLTVPADYNGDGTSDIAIFRPASGKWLVKDGVQVFYGFGTDTVVPGDYSGDGTADIAVFRPSLGKWLVRNGAQVFYGNSADTLVPGDYTGDGTWNFAVFRSASGRWLVKDGPNAYWGTAADTVQPGDYDGDGTLDFAVFRSSVGRWLVRGVTSAYYGASSDLPVTNP